MDRKFYNYSRETGLGLTYVRAVSRIWGAVIVTIPLLLLYHFFSFVSHQQRNNIIRYWYASMVWFSGLTICCYGKPANVHLVSNHVTYLDIPVLGSLQDVRFVSKSEVASWPVIGYFARLANTIFIERTNRHLKSYITHLTYEYSSSANICIFPEGTSTDGKSIRPFKSSLFQAAINAAKNQNIFIQPVTLNYMNTSNLYGEREEVFSWVGNDPLLPHLWRVLKNKSGNVDVIYHKPLRVADFENRKSLIAANEEAVSSGIKRK